MAPSGLLCITRGCHPSYRLQMLAMIVANTISYYVQLLIIQLCWECYHGPRPCASTTAHLTRCKSRVGSSDESAFECLAQAAAAHSKRAGAWASINADISTCRVSCHTVIPRVHIVGWSAAAEQPSHRQRLFSELQSPGGPVTVLRQECKDQLQFCHCLTRFLLLLLLQLAPPEALVVLRVSSGQHGCLWVLRCFISSVRGTVSAAAGNRVF